MTDAWDFSNITNPYGLMRSPWNTNPVPYVMRSNNTQDVFADGNTEFPTCSQFAAYLEESEAKLSTVLQALNGELHGPVHIMIGGQWDLLHDWSGYMSDMEFADNFLLLSKDLWRQGWLRTPDYCSADTPHEDCMARYRGWRGVRTGLTLRSLGLLFFFHPVAYRNILTVQTKLQLPRGNLRRPQRK